MRSKYSTYIIWLLWIVALLAASPTFFIYSEVFGYEYLQIDGLAIMLFFDTISFLLLVTIWKFFERIEIDNGAVRVSKAFGLIGYSFQLSDIRNYSLLEMKSRNSHSHELYLYLNDGRMIRLSSTPYSNFNELIPYFTTHKENISVAIKKPRRMTGWATLIAAYLLLITVIVYAWNNYVPVDKSYPVKRLGVVLTEAPNEFGKGSARKISFETKSHSDFYFIEYSSEHDLTANEDLLRDNKAGDSLYFYISELDYNTKITRTQTPDFYGKHFEWSEIRIYGIENSSWIYLKPPAEIVHSTSVDFFIILNSVFIALLLFLTMLTIFPEMLY